MSQRSFRMETPKPVFPSRLTYYFFTRFDAHPLAASSSSWTSNATMGRPCTSTASRSGRQTFPSRIPTTSGSLEANDSDDGQMFHRTVLEGHRQSRPPRTATTRSGVEVHQADIFSHSDVSFDLRLFDPGGGLLGNDEDIDDPAVGPPRRVGQQSDRPADPRDTGVSIRTALSRSRPPTRKSPAAPASAIEHRTPAEHRLGGGHRHAFFHLHRFRSPSSPLMTLGFVQFAATEDTPLVMDAASGPVGTIGVGVLANDTHADDETIP